MPAALTLVALLVSTAILPYTQWAGVVATAFFSGLWILANAPMEGDVLWVWSTTHGLTGGDLAGLAGIVIAGLRAWWLYRRTTRGKSDAQDPTLTV
ncbi:hypothetical protein [Nocardioides sp. GY 10127]|uniref:hypothetical protein n=1 Tax=Nocardioides sp. GY 10127 TaxID=2569762 RepID=UPI0010A80536|nr:hypothetical protein [Nocardioides sp. GY 10127]TIC79472.1 hypothetical protein E8D37_18075 [Nocardioides sp. GY 10127]